jgi:hypothetical protein
MAEQKLYEKYVKKIFNENELLCYDEIIILLDSPDTLFTGGIIADHLIKKMFISQDKLYILNQKNVTYKRVVNADTTNINATINEHIKQLISESWAKLNKFHDMLKKMYKSKIDDLFKVSHYSDMISTIKDAIRKDEILVDVYTNELHFDNGYLDLTKDDKKILPRVIGKHYVSKFVFRDYKEPSKGSIEWIENQLRKIYPIEDEYYAAIFFIFRTFTGTITKEQLTIFMTGTGASGKSTLMKLIQLALPCYFLELSSNIFTKGNKDINKILNQFEKEPQVLLSWANEPNQEKMDAELFKKFCEGIIQATKLYEDGLYTFINKTLTVISANAYPDMKSDTGSQRRILGFEHTSKFTENKNEVDNKTVFIMDKDLQTNFENNNDFKNALVSLIVDQCLTYNKGKKMKIPESFEKTKATICTINDQFQDFIDSKIVITNKDEHRIGKEDMKNEYLKAYPNRFANHGTIISSLKDKKINYEPKYRCDGVQGCFVGVRWKGDTEQKSDLTIEQQILSLENQKYGIEQMILKLKQQLPITKDDFEIFEKPIIKVEKHPIKTQLDNLFSKYNSNIEEHKRLINESYQIFSQLLNEWDKSKQQKVITKKCLTQKEEQAIRKRQVQNKDDENINDKEMIEFSNAQYGHILLPNIIMKYDEGSKNKPISKKDFGI